jgi:hypothetical protein
LNVRTSSSHKHNDGGRTHHETADRVDSGIVRRSGRSTPVIAVGTAMIAAQPVSFFITVFSRAS